MSGARAADVAVRFLRQRNEWDCGLAVAAMLTRSSYAAAVRADLDADAERGLSVAEFVGVAATLSGGTWSVSRQGYGLPFATWIARSGHQGDAAFVIRREADRVGHWIAVIGGAIYDPEQRRPSRLPTYPRRDWRVIRRVFPD